MTDGSIFIAIKFAKQHTVASKKIIKPHGLVNAVSRKRFVSSLNKTDLSYFIE